MRRIIYLGFLLFLFSCSSKEESKNKVITPVQEKDTVVVHKERKDTLPAEKDIEGKDSTVKPSTAVKEKKEDPGKDRPVMLDFTLTALDGTPYSLSQFKGKVVIIDFWATWCGPCRAGIPHLIELYNKYHSKGLFIIGVGLDDTSRLRQFVSEVGINYPTLIDQDKRVAGMYGIRAIPTTFFVDKKGRMAKRYLGFSANMVPEMEELIQNLLKE